MSSLKVVAPTFLFEQPDPTSRQLFPLLPDAVLRFPQGKPSDLFANVLFAPEGGVPISGFVLREKCVEISDGPPAAIDREAFVRECLIAERSMDALSGIVPWAVVADLLIARALVETDMTDADKLVGDGTGPLP